MEIPPLTDKEKEDIIGIIKENSYNTEILKNGGIFIQTQPNREPFEARRSPHKAIAEYLKTLEIK